MLLAQFASHAQNPSLESATESVSPIETDAEFYDVFAGTVQYKNQELQLRRCSLGNDLYLLDFQNPEEAATQNFAATKYKVLGEFNCTAK